MCSLHSTIMEGELLQLFYHRFRPSSLEYSVEHRQDIHPCYHRIRAHRMDTFYLKSFQIQEHLQRWVLCPFRASFSVICVHTCVHLCASVFIMTCILDIHSICNSPILPLTTCTPHTATNSTSHTTFPLSQNIHELVPDTPDSLFPVLLFFHYYTYTYALRMCARAMRLMYVRTCVRILRDIRNVRGTKDFRL